MTTDRREAAFDPERFRAEGHRLVDQLADYLGRASAGGLPVLPPQTPDAMLARWSGEFPEEAEGELGALVGRLLADSTHLHHPGWAGYQITPTLPVAALADLVGSLLNNGMAAYEGGPAATMMEVRVIRWLARQLGWGAGADGVLTSGGSLGNLTALLAARQAKAGHDAWGGGAHAGPPLAILTGEHAHYSVTRTAAIMGLGSEGVVAVASDAAHRMRPDALAGAKARAEAQGRRVIAVVANAGATAPGSFDPLGPIADFCAAHGLWLHVDGAHGASLALSRKYRELVAGIERADSVVWDAHKMLSMPALVTAVLFREGESSWATFAQEASYLYAGRDARAQWYNLGLRTAECTKRLIAAPLYLSLATLGTRMFADLVDGAIDLARRFGARLAAEPDFELLAPPECNIVCFRVTPVGVADLDALQDRVRAALIARGEFFVARTSLAGKVWLRISLMNPRTGDADLDRLLVALRGLGREGVAHGT